MRPGSNSGVPIFSVLLAGIGLSLSPSFAQDTNSGWITAWGTSQQDLGASKITDETVRMIARVTIPGDRIRIRLDNTFGTVPVTFGRVTAGLRTRGPALAAGLTKPRHSAEKRR